jgi:hypothetical protein
LFRLSLISNGVIYVNFPVWLLGHPVCKEEDTFAAVVCISTGEELLKSDIILDDPVCAALSVEELNIGDASLCIEVDIIGVLASIDDALVDPVPDETGEIKVDIAEIGDVDGNEDIELAIVLVIVIKDDVKLPTVPVFVNELLLIGMEFVTSDKVLMWLVSVWMDVDMIETVFGNDVLLNEVELIGISVEVVSMWKDVPLTIIGDDADAGVPVLIGVLPIIWLESVCIDDSDALVIDIDEVSECDNVAMVIVRSETDGRVTVSTVELLILSLVSVCDEEDIPVFVPGVISVCEDDWLDTAIGEVCDAVSLCIAVLLLDWIVSVCDDEDDVEVSGIDDVSVCVDDWLINAADGVDAITVLVPALLAASDVSICVDEDIPMLVSDNMLTCEDVWLMDIEDKVCVAEIGLVVVMLATWLVSVCEDDVDTPIIVVVEVSVCNDDWVEAIWNDVDALLLSAPVLIELVDVDALLLSAPILIELVDVDALLLSAPVLIELVDEVTLVGIEVLPGDMILLVMKFVVDSWICAVDANAELLCIVLVGAVLTTADVEDWIGIGVVLILPKLLVGDVDAVDTMLDIGDDV